MQQAGLECTHMAVGSICVLLMSHIIYYITTTPSFLISDLIMGTSSPVRWFRNKVTDIIRLVDVHVHL